MTNCCNVPGCEREVHDCHGGEIYLCERHWSDLVEWCSNGWEADDWWDMLISVILDDLTDVEGVHITYTHATGVRS